MSITSAKTGATGISLALENNFMEPIASTVVGSGGSIIVTFNDIPQTYKHLQLRFIGRNTSTNDGIRFRLNGDNGSNYTRHLLYGNGASVVAAAGTSTTSLGIANFPTSSTTASVFGAGVIDILDYANTSKYKTTRALAGFDANGSGSIFLYSGLWLNTDPVTSISFIWDANNSAEYSRISLYGIRG
jgi:hypothetical protein